MSWTHWRRYFEDNAQRPLPVIPEALPEIDDTLHAPLLACLGRLQLGERGEGRIAHQIDRATIPGIDDDYRRALKLMIREEGRHAAILGRLIHALGGRPLARHATASWFRIGRNLLGVRWKLWVLDVAEVVASGCYRQLADSLPAGAVRDAVDEIARDEAQHLAFHGELFSRLLARSPQLAPAVGVAWWLCGAAACAVVIASQGSEMAALGVSRRELGRSIFTQLQLGSKHLLAGCA